MKRLPKPEFGRVVGYLVDPMILPETVRRALASECVRGKYSADQTDAALVIAGEEAQFLMEYRPMTASTAIIQRELDTVSARARALLQALRQLQGGTVVAFSAHWQYLALGSSPPVELSEVGKSAKGTGLGGWDGSFLGTVWDLVQDLESSARYASTKCRPSKQAQLSRDQARALTRRVAERLRMLTGKLPPYSKGTWFPDFMAALCAWPELSLPCGRAIVESAVRSVDYPS